MQGNICREFCRGGGGGGGGATGQRLVGIALGIENSDPHMSSSSQHCVEGWPGRPAAGLDT